MSETAVIQLLHHVRAEHATTGEALFPLDAAFVGVPPPGWVITVKGGDVLVAARQGLPTPATPPALRVRVSNPRAALRLASPSIDIVLDQPELVHQFRPAPMTVTIDLVDRSGRPRTGRSIRARGSDQSTVSLPEVAATPGMYRSAPVQWASSFYPFDLLVNNRLLRKVAVDLTQTDTRLRVVDTT